MGCVASLKREIRRKHYLARHSSDFHYESKGIVIKSENRIAVKNRTDAPGMATIKINI